MALPNVFEPSVMHGLRNRIQQLSLNLTPYWGKMNAPQMLAHLNVMFELALEDKHPHPNIVARFLLRTIVKKGIVNEAPYPKNSRTAPEMIISHQPDFGVEKQRLLSYLEQVESLGAAAFDNRSHPSFGQLSTIEWSNAFYKHIDHHLKQFGL